MPMVRSKTMSRVVPLSLLFLVLVGVASFGQEEQRTLSDAEVKQLIIQESIRSYSGSCPCPYNTDRARRRCGARSAYSRPGGASPMCYERNVSDEQVAGYRQRHGINAPE